MLEIEFSVIIENPEELQALKELLEEFQGRFGISVKLRQLNWNNAWSELLTYALYNKEPDISHIGSTWCSSLVEMNALRALKPAEVALLGGQEAFLKPAWQSALVEEDTRTWSVPWTGYTNVIAYRRDLITKAGLSEFTHLESIGGILQIVRALREASVGLPWVMPTIGNVDIMHAAASWVWEAGGDFIDPINKKILFTEPAAIAGLCNYFKLYRCLPSPVGEYSETQCSGLLETGQAAICLISTKLLLGILRRGIRPEITQNLATAAISRIPWFGGGNLVIWKRTQYNVEKERAAINLIRFLTSFTPQVNFTQIADELPVTCKALEAVFPASHALSPAVQRAVSNGKPYRSTHLWGKVEKMLGQTLDLISKEVREDPNQDIEPILLKHLKPQARRFEMTLANR